MGRVLSIDVETYCELDLKAVGVAVYVAHPSFTVTVIAWAFDKDEPQSVSWPNTKALPLDIVAHLAYGDGVTQAFNAAFEWEVLTKHFGLKLEPGAISCTMQRSLVYGIPGNLLGAGQALRLTTLKDETAKAVMMKMAKPAKDGGPPWHTRSPGELAALAEYCRDDVAAERAVGLAVPQLSAFEKRVSALDARANDKGVKVDLPMVHKLLAVASRDVKAMNLRCTEITDGAITSPGTQHARIKQWLNKRGLKIPSTEKDVVEKWIRNPPQAVDAISHEVLELRSLAAKASVAKLKKMVICSDAKTGVMRGLLQFSGAGRTHRWAGRLVQLQNLPRPEKGLDVNEALAIAAADVAGLEMFYPSPLGVISSSLRGMLIPRAGKIFLSLDLSQIEARVVAWLAGQHDVLRAFRNGEDVYVLAAAKVGSKDRQLGKVLVLACGYGMGPAKFKDTAETYGIFITLAEAEKYVHAWRRGNRAIVGLWGAVQEAVVNAILNPGALFKAGAHIQVKVKKNVLWLRKPNGETLAYHRPRLEDGEIRFDGVDGYTKKWGEQRTYGGKLVENIVQSVARDILAEAMLRIEDELGETPNLSVHDEGIYELDVVGADDRAHIIQKRFDTVPNWAYGLPIGSDAKLLKRYGKG